MHFNTWPTFSIRVDRICTGKHRCNWEEWWPTCEKMRTLWPLALRAVRRRSSSCSLPLCSSSTSAGGKVGELSNLLVMMSGWLQLLRICISMLFRRPSGAFLPSSACLMASCSQQLRSQQAQHAMLCCPPMQQPHRM